MKIAGSRDTANWVRRIVQTIARGVEDPQSFDVSDLANALDRGPWWTGCPRAEEILAQGSRHGYRRIPLLEKGSHGHSILLIAWPPGHVTPIHDHDGLWGIELVLDGALEVETFALYSVPQLDLVRQGTSVLGIGDHTEFAESHYAHRCRNLSAHRPALSLHVYGGELESFRAFDRTHSGAWLGTNLTATREPALV